MLLERQALGPGLGVSWLQGRALGTENPRQVPLGTQVPLCMDAGLTLTQGTVKAAATVLGLSGGGGAWPEHGCRELLPHVHACTHTYARIHTSLHYSPGEKLAQELQPAEGGSWPAQPQHL